jgi:hypothetical protein
MKKRVRIGIVKAEKWMTPQERVFYSRFAASIEYTLDQRGIEMTSMTALRVNDVVVSFVLVRRLESTLNSDAVAAETATKPQTLIALVDGIGKAREKMRKALKELEDVCGPIAMPQETGFADRMKSIVKRADVAVL